MPAPAPLPYDDSGAAASEYALLVAAIAALVVAILFSLGTLVFDVFEQSCEHVATTVTSAEPGC